MARIDLPVREAAYRCPRSCCWQLQALSQTAGCPTCSAPICTRCFRCGGVRPHVPSGASAYVSDRGPAASRRLGFIDPDEQAYLAAETTSNLGETTVTRPTMKRIDLDDPAQLRRLILNGAIWSFAQFWQGAIDLMQREGITPDQSPNFPDVLRTEPHNDDEGSGL